MKENLTPEEGLALLRTLTIDLDSLGDTTLGKLRRIELAYASAIEPTRIDPTSIKQ